MLLAILLFSLLLYHGYCNHYYVIPDEYSGNCPRGKECHNLTYYINKSHHQPTKDLTLVFLNGHHTLDGTLSFQDLNSLTLKRNGNWIHGSVKESLVIIECSNDSYSGISITSVKHLNIEMLTIDGCRKGVVMDQVEHFYLHQVSIQNSLLSGMASNNSTTGIIQNCHFHRNCLMHKTNCYHLALIGSNHNKNPIKYNITETIFSFGAHVSASCFISNNVHVLYMKNCSFQHNKGKYSGGLQLEVNQSSSIDISDSKFINNSAAAHTGIGPRTAGGMFLKVKKVYKFYITNNLFKDNLNKGASIVSNSHLHMRDTVFISNIGGGLFLHMKAKLHISNVSIKSTSSYSELRWKESALTLLCHNTYAFLKAINITNNWMTGLFTLKCKAVFKGLSVIANNTSPDNGGGMWSDERSFITSSANGIVHFVNNTAADKGGAIFSQPQGSVYMYFLKYCSLTRLKSSFSGNNAKYGKDIYGGHIYNCNKHFRKFRDILECEEYHWPLISNITKPLSSKISSNSFGVCTCSDSSPNCFNRSVTKQVYPGQEINLSLVTVGFCGGLTTGTLVVKSNRVNVTLRNSYQQTTDSCMNFTYKLEQTDVGKNGSFEIGSGTYYLSNSTLIVNVEFLPCPLGLTLKSGACVCNDVIRNFSSEIKCNVSGGNGTITKSGNNWLYYDPQHNCTVAHQNCPFDYCVLSTVSLNLRDPDLQCRLNRSGILCGRCQPGLSLMIGSNQCSRCENKYLSLIVVFIVAGIVKVLVLLISNQTVSIGNINGLLFYANVIKLNEAVFFPNGFNVPVVSQFISWINLDFGIQTCFFNGLDGYWKTWLQFTFPIYVWLMIGSIIIICRYSSRFSRLCGNNTVPVLATLILMSYSKLIRTITSVFMKSTIKCSNQERNVWTIDGNVEYLRGKHAVLFATSLVCLLMIILYTVLVFSGQWLQKFSGKLFCNSSIDPVVKLKPLIDAYGGPYEDRHRYLTGMFLILRIIFSSVFSYTSGSIINNYIILFVLFVPLILRMKYGNLYRSTVTSSLESFYIFNLAFLCILTALCYQMNWDPTVARAISISSISLCLVVFLATVIAHLYVFTAKCTKSKTKVPKEPVSKCKDEEFLYSPSKVVRRRDSIIFELEVPV